MSFPLGINQGSGHTTLRSTGMSLVKVRGSPSKEDRDTSGKSIQAAAYDGARTVIHVHTSHFVYRNSLKYVIFVIELAILGIFML